MVIIPLTRQVCKGASPEPEPLSAQRAISCKYVSVSIGALAWGFYALTACLTTSFLCGAFALRNFVFLFLFKGVWGCTSLREDDGTSPANYAVAKWPLVLQNMQTYSQKVTLMQNLHEWYGVLTRNVQKQTRCKLSSADDSSKHMSKVINFNKCISQMFCSAVIPSVSVDR